MKKFTTIAIAAALAAALTVPTSAAGLLFSKISFVSNGGTEIKPAVTCLGMTIDLTKYVPEREGYTFTGWFADEELTEAVTELKAGDYLKLFAGWEEVVIEEPVEDETDAEVEDEAEETVEADAETEAAE